MDRILGVIELRLSLPQATRPRPSHFDFVQRVRIEEHLDRAAHH
jgi:hypothetical protein